ncbi:hypothetical protein MWU65_05495 [Cellulophaga sp. F20128]|uniref:hypothetical protein n=1 Tax=Cellulophaga sp. F20128 TaxID=2926413 RepID=UPI001FF69453|nr:hypothetical protein [Cellulophaga sp. F20128]MCK0156622.1 hypothetical protein [Cellulophaga sp. F20128]
MADRNELTFKSFLQTITIIHIAFIGGLLVFSAIAYFQFTDWVFILPTNDLFFIITPTLALASIYLGNFLFRKKISAILGKKSLRQRLTTYQSAILIKFAFTEGAAFVCIMIALLKGNLFYLGLALLCIVYFISLKPTQAKIEQQLALKGELKEQMDKGNIN